MRFGQNGGAAIVCVIMRAIKIFVTPPAAHLARAFAKIRQTAKNPTHIEMLNKVGNDIRNERHRGQLIGCGGRRRGQGRHVRGGLAQQTKRGDQHGLCDLVLNNTRLHLHRVFTAAQQFGFDHKRLTGGDRSDKGAGDGQ